LVTTGDLNISNAKLSRFGLASKMAALSAFTGVKQSLDTVIQALSSNLRIAPEGIRLDGLNLVVSDLGTITGAGTIDANIAGLSNIVKPSGTDQHQNLGGILGGLLGKKKQ
jgi:hypothetical protein